MSEDLSCRLNRAFLQIVSNMHWIETELSADATMSQLLRFDDCVDRADADIQKVRDFFDVQKFGKCNN